MKSRLSKVLDKMPKDKIELAKVELGIADDISDALKRGNTIVKTLQGLDAELKAADKILVNEIKAAVKKADAEQVKADKLYKVADKQAMSFANILDKAEQGAKDLGVNASAISGYKELDKVYEQIDTLTKKVFIWSDLDNLVKGF
jgi:hypothetical protein